MKMHGNCLEFYHCWFTGLQDLMHTLPRFKRNFFGRNVASVTTFCMIWWWIRDQIPHLIGCQKSWRMKGVCSTLHEFLEKFSCSFRSWLHCNIFGRFCFEILEEISHLLLVLRAFLVLIWNNHWIHVPASIMVKL